MNTSLQESFLEKNLTVQFMTDGFGPPPTEGWQSFNKCTEKVLLRMKQHFGVWNTPDLEAVL
jgi:hypothetical protein